MGEEDKNEPTDEVEQEEATNPPERISAKPNVDEDEWPFPAPGGPIL